MVIVPCFYSPRSFRLSAESFSRTSLKLVTPKFLHSNRSRPRRGRRERHRSGRHRRDRDSGGRRWRDRRRLGGRRGRWRTGLGRGGRRLRQGAGGGRDRRDRRGRRVDDPHPHRQASRPGGRQPARRVRPRLRTSAAYSPPNLPVVHRAPSGSLRHRTSGPVLVPVLFPRRPRPSPTQRPPAPPRRRHRRPS